MARDIGNFRDVVERRSQFYESADLRTIAVEQESDWYNLHTDVHLRPEKPDQISVSTTEVLGPAAYFRDVVSFDELWTLLPEMFGGEYSGFDEPVVFPGLSADEDGEDYWKENIYRANYWDCDRADDAYGILVQSSTEDPLPDRNEFQEKLRQLNPPYYDVDDLCREHLGHTSYRWSSPQTQFFAPLYVKVTEHEITESGDLELKIQTHESIADPVVSTWAKKDREIIDRARHKPAEPQSLGGCFHQFSINWEIEGNPSDVYTSIFHSMFDQIRESSRLSSSVPVIALETVLGMTDEELSNFFDQILITPDKQTLDKVSFADDFEAAVITLFSLAGFLAFSPDWFDHFANKGSLPDLLAYFPEESVLLVGECTLADSDDKVKTKVNDALASAHQIEDRFDEIDLLDPMVIPVCITPAESVSPVGVPDDVELLTGPNLQKIKRQAEKSGDAKNVLREWNTYNQEQQFR